MINALSSNCNPRNLVETVKPKITILKSFPIKIDAVNLSYLLSEFIDLSPGAGWGEKGVRGGVAPLDDA